VAKMRSLNCCDLPCHILPAFNPEHEFGGQVSLQEWSIKFLLACIWFNSAKFLRSYLEYLN
jgi:hypothetical protein